MDAQRDAEVLDDGPQRVVGFVMQVAAADGVGSHVEAGGTLGRRALGFLDREIGCLYGEHGRHPQPFGRGAAVLQAPVVVRTADGGQQLGVVELLAEHLAPDGGVEHLRIDTVGVHVRQARLGPESLGAGLLVLLHAARRRLVELLRVHGIAAVLLGDRLALHAHACATVTHVADPGRTVGESGVDVVGPDVRRLHLVRVRVENAKTVAHACLPLANARATLTVNVPSRNCGEGCYGVRTRTAVPKARMCRHQNKHLVQIALGLVARVMSPSGGTLTAHDSKRPKRLPRALGFARSL